MKAVIEFQLPEEQEEFNTFSNASKYYSTLWDLDQWLRGIIKYDDSLTDEQETIYQKVRDRLHEELTSNGVSFN
jgi:hypothetical protein